MGKAKAIHVEPISSACANKLIRRLHYSQKVVPNSQLHLGVFLGGSLHGAMQFGPSMDKRRSLGLVRNTGWNQFLELNRMAFDPLLPRNSESRALAISFRLIRREYPHIKWILSYADATQCGDGTIYRAAGFLLIGIKSNRTILQGPNGEVVADKTLNHAKNGLNASYYKKKLGYKPLEGHQLRYIFFLDPARKADLAVPIIPFSAISKMGCSMYLGKSGAGSKANVAIVDQTIEGGVTPTPALHTELVE